MAALPRAVYLFVHPPAAHSVYWALSDDVLRNGSLAIAGQPTTMYEPLYPMFVAAARIVLRAPALVDLLQVLVAAIGVAFLYRLTAALTDDARVAVAAAALYAIDPLLVREAVGRSDSALFTTLLIAFAAAFVTADTQWRVGLAGLCLGLATLTRTTAAPLVVIAPAILASRGARRSAVALFIVAAAIALPFTLRNHALNGTWWPTRSGVNLYIGNSARTSEVLPRDDLDLLQRDAAAAIRAKAPALESLPPLDQERETDRFLTREALAFMTAHPAETFRRKVLNVWYLLSPAVVPYRALNPETGVPQDRPRAEIAIYAVSTSVVLILAAFGVYRRRFCWRADAILLAIALVIAAVNVVYVPATRYRAPMEFVLLFYAAGGAASAVRCLL